MNKDCWVLKEGEGPRPNPGDIACWLQSVTKIQDLRRSCPDGRTCYEVPQGLRGPQPGDTLCWPGKGKSGPSAGEKAVWEAKRSPGEPNKIVWEGRSAGIEDIFTVHSPKAAGNNRVLPIKPCSKSSNNTVRAVKVERATEEVRGLSNFPVSKSYPQLSQGQPNFSNLTSLQQNPSSKMWCRPNSYNPNLLGPSVSAVSSSSSASSSQGKFKFNNAFFCNCKIPLPPWAKEKKRKKQNCKKSAPPLCAVTCGNPQCAAAKFTKQEYKCIPISKGYYDDPKPGICCYLYCQTVFNTSDKKNKPEDNNTNFPANRDQICPTYKINSNQTCPFRQPQQVQLIKPLPKHTVDNENDSFLLNISKKDHCGKPAKLNLSFKIPKTKITYKYDEESQFPEIRKKPKKAGSGKKKGKGKKSAKGKKGKGKKGTSKGKKKGKGKKK